MAQPDARTARAPLHLALQHSPPPEDGHSVANGPPRSAERVTKPSHRTERRLNDSPAHSAGRTTPANGQSLTGVADPNCATSATASAPAERVPWRRT